VFDRGQRGAAAGKCLVTPDRGAGHLAATVSGFLTVGFWRFTNPRLTPITNQLWV